MKREIVRGKQGGVTWDPHGRRSECWGKEQEERIEFPRISYRPMLRGKKRFEKT